MFHVKHQRPGDMNHTVETLLAHYPALADLPDTRLEADLAACPLIEIPERTILFRETEPCGGFPFVLAGQIKVARGSPDGRELELYRVHAGQICVISTGCLVGSGPMNAHGITTAPTRLIVVSRGTLLGWLEYPSVRMLMLGQMAERMAELMALVEAVAFQRLDRRLARALLGRGPTVPVTHQALADELGTAREMVSRLLRRFEEQSLVRLGREQIALLDESALSEIAHRE